MRRKCCTRVQLCQCKWSVDPAVVWPALKCKFQDLDTPNSVMLSTPSHLHQQKPKAADIHWHHLNSSGQWEGSPHVTASPYYSYYDVRTKVKRLQAAHDMVNKLMSFARQQCASCTAWFMTKSWADDDTSSRHSIDIKQLICVYVYISAIPAVYTYLYAEKQFIVNHTMYIAYLPIPWPLAIA